MKEKFMQPAKLLLITGRSLKQGNGLNIGKETADYKQVVSTVELNPQDMSILGVQDGESVKVTTAGGEITVQCRGTDVPPGLAFMAYGPLTSQLMDQETHGSGMPSSKGFEVEVERVN
jgi:formylmethanofuran dehydrogenase subunit D